jgi:hypothetical protein
MLPGPPPARGARPRRRRSRSPYGRSECLAVTCCSTSSRTIPDVPRLLMPAGCRPARPARRISWSTNVAASVPASGSWYRACRGLPPGSVPGHPDVGVRDLRDSRSSRVLPVNRTNARHVVECLADLYGPCWGGSRRLPDAMCHPPRTEGRRVEPVAGWRRRRLVCGCCLHLRLALASRATTAREWQPTLHALVRRWPTTVVRRPLVGQPRMRPRAGARIGDGDRQRRRRSRISGS